MKHICRNLIGSLVCLALLGAASPASAQPAPDGNSVLIMGDTVGFASPSLEEQKAVALGFTVVIDNAAAWAARTTADFATFKAIILGDPTCTSYGPTAAAEANRSVWSPAITGNIVVVGTDPTFHSYAGFVPSQGGDKVAEAGIAFAADEAGKTGAYITLSCYYHGTAPGTPVPLLDQFGSFTVRGVDCYNDIHIVASHPALGTMTEPDIENWSCSVHEAFDAFPSDFLPLVIAENIGCSGGSPTEPGAIAFGDGTCGTPYIMARGEELVPAACGDGTIDVGEECDDGNTANGDGCSAQCTIEVSAIDCSLATASSPMLWPPNHKMESISIDGLGDATIAVTSVTQDEPVNEKGQGAGNTSPDASLDPLAVRAERNGNPKTPGDGRVYHISFTATSGASSCSGEVTVCVPHDQRPGAACVDGGPLYSSIP